MDLAPWRNRRPHAWVLAVAGAFAVVWTVMIFGHVGGAITERDFSDYSLAIVALGAGISCIVTSRKAEGRYRLVWLLLGLGVTSWGIGQVVWTYYEAMRSVDVPFPSLADAGYLTMVPLIAAAMVLLPAGTRSAAGRARTILDGLIVASSLMLVSWLLVLGTVFHNGTGTIFEQVLSLAYPIGDVVIVTITLYAMLRARQTGRQIPLPLMLVAIGLLCFSFADSGFTYLTQTDSYSSGDPIDSGWFFGFLMVFLAARTPGRLHGDNEDDSAVPRSMGLLLPYAAVVLALLTTVIEIARSASSLNAFVSWDRSLIIALLVGRQVLTMRENLLLTDDLGHRVVEIRASEQRFESLVHQSSDVVSLVDSEAVVLYQSESSRRVFGYAADDLRGTRITDLLDDNGTAVLRDAIAAASEVPGSVSRVQVTLRHHDGHTCDVEIAITNLLDDPTVGGVVLNIRDVSERNALERQLVHQAFHDSLTALANRALLRDRIDEVLGKQDGETVRGAVLFLDLDGFKEINDSLGHASGDILLTRVGERLRSCVRPHDTVARLGGDEFAILLEDAERDVDSYALAARILASLNAPFAIDGREIFVRASIGIATADPAVEESDQLLRNADLAMYQAKSSGGSRIQRYDPSLHAQLLERLQFEDDLRRALGRGELTLHYQPIVELATGRAAGVEALLRWQHPTRGLVSPDRFIPIAERTGLIHPIGRWVLHEACRQAMIWRSRHPLNSDLSVSVNISARQFQSEDLIDDIMNALEETGLPAEALELEMTESVLFEHTDENVSQLQRLKALGIKLAIDDFGTGYSSLAYLHRFAVDVLKIDRTFISQLNASEAEQELVRNILRIGQSLHMTTIAEGIETEEQWTSITGLGCDLGQGYHFARPLPASKVDEWLTSSAVGETVPTF